MVLIMLAMINAKGGVPVATQPCTDLSQCAWNVPAWSTCSKPCGGGTQTRNKSILAQPVSGGLPCPSSTSSERSQTQACNTKVCNAFTLIS